MVNEQGEQFIRDRAKAKAESTSAAAGSNRATGQQIGLIRATDIQSDVPVWAWKYRGSGCIQRGSLALFGGRPGTGKSTAARWFAARYSRGEMDGCWWNNPGHVAYIAPSEESLKYTIKPGLYAAGADMTRIHFPRVTLDDKEVRLSSLYDENKLTEVLLGTRITVVIVDPVMSTISGKVGGQTSAGGLRLNRPARGATQS